MQVDLVCLSHLRWDFVYQRPQHLMSRFASSRRVFFIEEPVLDQGPAHLEMTQDKSMVCRVVPHLPVETRITEISTVLQMLLDDLFCSENIRKFNLWYYSPLFLPFTRHLPAEQIIFDCMDELSLFKGAPQELKELEVELLKRADLVFTGGQSLYEAKKNYHANIHCFPSSIDRNHFSRARLPIEGPADQKSIPSPRLGFFGVIDERMDLELLAAVADARPDWQLVILGPVVKIDPGSLPQRANIHYLGIKAYQDLPTYLAGWDIALLPFARNESTRFISPTKTPEYLAGGKPVVSTPIRDIVSPYGEKGLVWIADTHAEFIQAIEEALSHQGRRSTWLQEVDEFLANHSWDETWMRMNRLMEGSLALRDSR